jgi:hypothetical protein
MPRMSEQLSRGGSGRRDGRDKGGMQHGSGMQPMSDGWNMVGSSSARKVDLTRFGQVRSTKISSTNMNLAPTARLASGSKGWPTDIKDRDEKGASMSRTHSTSNTYSVLLNNDQGESRKSIDGSSSESTPTPPERQKVVLQRGSTLSTEGASKTTDNKWQPSKSSGGATKPASAQLSPEEAKRKIKAMVDEYWSVKDKKVS